MLRTLVVDDEDAILRLLKTVLELNGFAVTLARSAYEGCAVLGQQSFDVVLTDLKMETQLAGFDVVRAAQQVSPRPVIAIITAFPIPASDWRHAGADALYVKGADTLRLPDCLKRLVEQCADTHVRTARGFAS